MKLGAVDYLAKPADADDVIDALLAPHNAKAAPPDNPMSADRVRWEHIQRVYELCNRNGSETARRLNMHRARCSASRESAPVIGACLCRILPRLRRPKAPRSPQAMDRGRSRAARRRRARISAS